MRRDLAPAGHIIAACRGCNTKAPNLRNLWRDYRFEALAIISNGARVGTLGVLDSLPGGVQFPGAPPSFIIITKNEGL